jgi:hypothetical protein
MRDAGFAEPSAIPVLGGLMTIHVATKDRAAARDSGRFAAP